MELSRFKLVAFAVFLGAAAWALQSAPASAQSNCKGLAQATCAGSAECGWVSGYKTKTGRSVGAYCRATRSKGASAGARSKAAVEKTAGTAKADSMKAAGKAKGAAKKKAASVTDKAGSAERKEGLY